MNSEDSHGKIAAAPSRSRASQEKLRALVAVKNRERLCAQMRDELTREFGWEEVVVHISSMPQQYWARVDAEGLRWHLLTLHALFQQIAGAHTTTTSPVVRWRSVESQGVTEVAICSWDRPGLLMNIAGALSRAGFNILRADVYTRADHLALDIFQVCAADGRSEPHDIRLRYASRLLAAAMAAPHSFAISERSDEPMARDTVDDSMEVTFDNESSQNHTILRVDAQDHVGLLFHLLEACVASGIDVKHATIVTTANRAKDVFCITDMDGRKIEDSCQLDAICRALRLAAGRSFNFAPPVWGVDPLHLVEPQP